MSIVPLSVIPPGQTVEITELHGGYKFKKKLSDMGIYIGSVLSISPSGDDGFVIIKSGSSRIGIGVGMAHKIFVKVAENQSS